MISFCRLFFFLLLLFWAEDVKGQNSIAEGIGSIFNVRRSGVAGALLPELFSVDVKLSNLTIPNKLMLELKCTNRTIHLQHSVNFHFSFSFDFFLYVVSGSLILCTTFAFLALSKFLFTRQPQPTK